MLRIKRPIRAIGKTKFTKDRWNRVPVPGVVATVDGVVATTVVELAVPDSVVI